MPEPHILLIVVAPAASGSPAPIAACRAGRLALARRQDAAHQDFVDACRRDLRPLDRSRDRARAERGGGNVLEVAEKAAHWRARRADDDDGVCCHWIGSPLALKRPRDVASRWTGAQSRRLSYRGWPAEMECET